MSRTAVENKAAQVFLKFFSWNCINRHLKPKSYSGNRIKDGQHSFVYCTVGSKREGSQLVKFHGDEILAMAIMSGA